MKYIEAEKNIEALSSKYSAELNDFSKYFNINYKGSEIAYIDDDERYGIGVWNQKYFSKLPFSNKLYMILAELAATPLDERKEDKKYFIHVFKGYDGYLNFAGRRPELNDIHDSGIFKTKFTNKEIEELKQRDDVPLDWSKVTLEETNED